MESKNKNLILAPSNKESLVTEWVANNEIRNFDVWLTYYDDDYYDEGFKKIVPTLGPGDNDKVFVEKGFKYPKAYEIISTSKTVFDYEYVWMPDDDILLDTESINKFFSIMKEYDLWLAMPSIDRSSHRTFGNQLHQAGNILRYVGFVEVQCPAFSNYALKKCYQTFNESQSGWGIDLVWPALLGRPLNKIAIVDGVIAKHTRPVGAGDLYKRLNVDPDAEMHAMKNKYGVKMDGNIYGYVKKENGNS